MGDAYYYLSVAMLEGEEPFCVGPFEIECILDYMSVALECDGNKALYHYFLAYVVNDYYESKYIRCRLNSKDLKADAFALGLTSEDVEAMFNMLKIKIRKF